MSDPVWDYVIVGAGSAGCVLANRLSEDADCRVLLLEAGSDRDSLFLRMPRGFAKTMQDAAMTWRYPLADAPEAPPWLRGRTLGGSSAINGMIYTRGQQQDYDDWEAGGAQGWGWDAMAPAFGAVEGALHVSPHPDRLAICDAVIDAGVALGLPEKADVNEGDQRGIGYLPRTIRDGRRESAATAFLHPVRRRANLSIRTGAMVQRLRVAEGRVIGVETSEHGQSVFHAAREVILCCGTFNSPKLLQLSGIGPAAALVGLGIDMVRDSPEVGANLREHYCIPLQARLRVGKGNNHRLRGLGLLRSFMTYLVSRKGPLSYGSYEVGAFVDTAGANGRPDAHILFSPISVAMEKGKIAVEPQPGIHALGFAMRPESKGSVMIASRDALDAPLVRPQRLVTAYDIGTSIALFRWMRRLFDQPPLDSWIGEQSLPPGSVETDDEIVAAYHQSGLWASHAIGTCRMGAHDGAVLDPRLRVRGVDGLRVVDASVMPAFISGNPNGPVMAMAWRAADLILEDRRLLLGGQSAKKTGG